MTGSVALDVVIGLIFVFLLYSLLASVLSEILSNYLNLRGRVLMKAISRMLNNPKENLTKFEQFLFLFGYRMPCPKNDTLAYAFYNHSLLRFLSKSDKKRPSYIAGNDFTRVIVDLLTKEYKEAGESYAEQIKEFFSGTNHQGIPMDEETYKFLKNMWAEAQGDLDRFKALLETWFDNTMERTTGWYKKYTQAILFFIGFVIAVTFNVDTISIAEKLKSDPKLREQIVQQADNFLKEHPTLSEDLRAAEHKRDSLSNIAVGKNLPTANDSLQKDAQAKAARDTVAANDALNRLKIIEARQNDLRKQADSLLKKDIANVNDILGLGYVNPWDCGSLSHTFCSKEGWRRTFGWALTAIAISLGAPFWFDLLNKLMQLRSAIKIPNAGAGKKDGDNKDSRTANPVG